MRGEGAQTKDAADDEDAGTDKDDATDVLLKCWFYLGEKGVNKLLAYIYLDKSSWRNAHVCLVLLLLPIIGVFYLTKLNGRNDRCTLDLDFFRFYTC